MILHSDREVNDCIRKLRCHCIQIMHSDNYSETLAWKNRFDFDWPLMFSKWKKEKTPAGSSVSSQKLLWPLVFLSNEGCKHGWKMLQKDIILLLCSLLLQRSENWWSFRERHDLDAQPHPVWRTRNQTTLSRQVFKLIL